MMERRPHLIPCVAATVVLLGALAEWPYGYYTLLRWVVCAAACYVAWRAYAAHEEPTPAVWLFGFVAVLFNPLVPVHLSRVIWAPIDVAAAAVFVVAAFLRFGPDAGEDEDGAVTDSGTPTDGRG